MSAWTPRIPMRWRVRRVWRRLVGGIRPPLSLGASPIFLRDDFKGREPGTALRQCEGIAHVYETVPGECQCGQRWWNGEVEMSNHWITLEDDRAL